ncbi:MAG: PD-(D/E)XK nuclease family protein [Clostridiales bacterium]|jgi:ATP-dependent helicase/nuclease subunit B|nr:PD-(D/E)XK nuclease family protein [Clostridiales bacterium]
MASTCTFIIGRAGSGKTRHITACIRAHIQNHRRAVLIVPEQFTYEAERTLIRALGGLLGVQVLSFTRLSERAAAAQDRPFLSPQGRRMVVRRAAYQLKKELGAFSPIASRAGFAACMDELIVMCRRFFITPDMLLSSARLIRDNPSLEQKLTDIATLYAATQQYMQQHFIDSEDALNAFLDGLPHSFLCGMDVYIDGLETVSAKTYAVIEGLLKYTRSLTIALCIDPEENVPDAKLFYPERQAYARIQELAAGLGCGIYVKECRTINPLKAPALIYLDYNLFACPARPYTGALATPMPVRDGNCGGNEVHGVADEEGKPFDAIMLTGATSRMAEVEAMAEQLLAFVRGGLRYREVAVIASDMGAYATAVQRAFHLRGIPVFFDAGKRMQGHPVVELLLAATQIAACGVTRADLLRIAKTGLANVLPEQTELLENYCLRRGLTGGRVFENPFPTEEELPEQARQTLLPPLMQLRAAFSDAAAGKKTRALYAYLAQLGVPQQLEDEVRRLGEEGRFALMDEHAQVWDVLMEMFSQLYAILGEASMSRREYLEVLQEALCAYQVGIIPATADQVLFGDIARTRSREVRALFVLGCNGGFFPRPQADDALLDDMELQELTRLGITLWGDSATRAREDQLTLYRALAKATGYLWLGFSYSDGAHELTPASMVDRIRAIFPRCHEQATIGKERYARLAQNEDGAFSLLMHNLDKLHEPYFAALAEYFLETKTYAPRLRLARAFAAQPAAPREMGETLATRLYGKRLFTSVSRLQTFRSCPFRHFVQYGLNVKQRPEFREKRLDIGSFSHMALERFVSALKDEGKTPGEIGEDEATVLIGSLLEECLDGYAGGLLRATARARALSVFWCDAVRDTALSMCRSMRGGGFAPLLTELPFTSAGGADESGGLPPLETQNAVISGVIDRVDAATAPDGKKLMRVVDYKTGGAQWNYSLVADGQALQLPIYLHAVKGLDGKATGMFYQPVHSPVVDECKAQSVEDALRPVGLMAKEAGVVEAAARRLEGYSPPKSTLIEQQQLDALLDFAVRRAGQIAEKLLQGHIAATPVYRGRGDSCGYCDYSSVCRFDARLPGCRVRRIKRHNKQSFFDMLQAPEKGADP